MITCKVRTIPENIIMSIPDWITNYQPVDDVDARLFDYFHQLYTQTTGSKEQKRIIKQIYNILFSQKLLLTSSHDDYNEAVFKNLQWFRNIIILITPELINLLTKYCQTHQSETITKISEHLQTLQTEFVNSRKYRETENYLGKQIDNLLTELKNSDSWNLGANTLFDVCDLELPNIGKIICCPVLPDVDNLHLQKSSYQIL